MLDLRIGHGYDVHAFTGGDHVMVCGVRIPYSRGVRAHSDGDVGLHALCDALLGAAGMPDIGQLFPDDAPQFSGADSRVLLQQVMNRLAEASLSPIHADITLVAEAPKMKAHVAEMRQVLSGDLGLPRERVNVKATTTERLGALGREEGLAAHAVVLLAPSEGKC
ncbi:2-C-methyl-D-erythritol 2,4-cyclodiphosphate synthase [Natronospira proteinivora]|uniref:2-C-methyl-D-erythritol 2,4-cyclodiphosphate synthase n=1 Tax=Natronospira proteinivora TaxID=1807133 RepID=A0ABT1G6C4_9GAMM|nr:2-C-methyl-D-erythritol 2,4-cyclodiphosphate synthase [Natronospira proteinivora]MCP1726642.1 2-C-methyl-D-erythritol 2,4-cyclodiphosphate synthase [Natronospira proteinivora]